jgi:muconate cycloisomerase
MADEAATSIQDVFRIAKYRAGNSIALKPCKHGGMTGTKKVVGIAEAAGLGLYGGTMIESSLGTAACAQLYSTVSDLKFGTEIFGPLLFKDNVTVNDIKFENFEVVVPDGPGFGMEIDKEKVKHYAREFSGKQEMMN